MQAFWYSCTLLPSRTIWVEEAEEILGGMGACNVGGPTSCICTTPSMRKHLMHISKSGDDMCNCSIGVITAQS